MGRTDRDDGDVECLTEPLGLVVHGRLPARSNDCWRVNRGAEELVLRRHRDLLGRGLTEFGRCLRWQAEAQNAAAGACMPVPHLVDRPFEHDGSWWSLEQYLPGASRALRPEEQARVIRDWHTLEIPSIAPPTRPGMLDHLALLGAHDVGSVLRRCEDSADRSWLLHRYGQATVLAEDIDWTASRRTLVHGDLIPQNLLWDGDDLSGIIDLELTRLDRRVTELINTW